MNNPFKRLIQSGGKAVGIFNELGGIASAECIGLSGLDFFIIDCEHGPYDVESAQLGILAGERHGCTPFVRVKEISRSSLLKMLDVGAMGLIVPALQTVEEAREIIRYAKYMPLGERGFAQARVSGFGQKEYARDMAGQCEISNRETLLFPQCETLGCLDHIEEIAALPGIDGIFVGPYDLSIAIGIPGRFDEPAFLAAVSRVLHAAKENGKYSMIFAADVERARGYLQSGFDAVAIGMDAMVLIGAMKAAKAAVQKAE